MTKIPSRSHQHSRFDIEVHAFALFWRPCWNGSGYCPASVAAGEAMVRATPQAWHPCSPSASSVKCKRRACQLPEIRMELQGPSRIGSICTAMSEAQPLASLPWNWRGDVEFGVCTVRDSLNKGWGIIMGRSEKVECADCLNASMGWPKRLRVTANNHCQLPRTSANIVN